MWSAVPIVISGVGGAFSVVAVNSWMNQPQGFTLDSAGNVTDVKPLEVLFNPAAGYEFFHMLLAAYMVAGFLIASVYAVGMLRGRRDRYHRLGFIIPFTVARDRHPIQLFVGDTAARPSPTTSRPSSPRWSASTRADRTDRVPRRYLHRWQGQGRNRHPRARLVPGGFQQEHGRHRPQSDPQDDQPPAKTMLHLAFDTMVGIATLLFLLAAWFAITWWRKRDLPEQMVPARRALAGVATVVALECGWIVTEVGRQPWIVNGYMRTADAVTPAQGIWWVFGLTMALYIGLAVIAIVVLRGLSGAGARAGRSRSARFPTDHRRKRGRERAHEQGGRLCGDLWFGVTLYAIFGGADFGAGLWDLFAGSGERARRVRARSTGRSGPSGRRTTSG
jgi:cytochrome d ubiquinol oxidase subunit I